MQRNTGVVNTISPIEEKRTTSSFIRIPISVANKALLFYKALIRGILQLTPCLIFYHPQGLLCSAAYTNNSIMILLGLRYWPKHFHICGFPGTGIINFYNTPLRYGIMKCENRFR